MTNAALNRRRLLFHKQIWLKIKEETSKILRLEHNFFWCWNLETSEGRATIPGKVWNGV